MSDETISNTGTLVGSGLVDHSADEPVAGSAGDPPVANDNDPPAEQPNPMAHWLMIMDNIVAGFRHIGSLSPMHAPLAGYARKIEAELAMLKTLL